MEKSFFLDRLREGLNLMGLETPSAVVLDELYLYQSILSKWNKTLNLTAHRTSDSMIERNFLDCLALVPHLSSLSKVMDLGSGAGFPGIIIKILWPKMNMTLVEADQRKAAFLATVIRELGLSDIEISNVHLDNRKIMELRWEEVFDGVVSRATIPFQEILPLISRCLKRGSCFFGMLVEEIKEEIKGIEQFQSQREIDYILPFSQQKRRIRVLKKINLHF